MNSTLAEALPVFCMVIVGIILINANQLSSFPDFSQIVVKGVVLLIVVAFDVYQKSGKAKETVAKVAA